MKKKVAMAGAFQHARQLVNFLNKEGILQEQIVSVFKEGEQIVLIYYGYED